MIDSDSDASLMGVASDRFAKRRTAVLIGFAKGLEDALAGLLGSRGFAVCRAGTVVDTMALVRTTVVELLVASDRCAAAAVIGLVDELGERRTARVVVLLAGRDVDAERRYREAGVRYVLTMPVTVEDLLRAGAAGMTGAGNEKETTAAVVEAQHATDAP